MNLTKDRCELGYFSIIIKENRRTIEVKVRFVSGGRGLNLNGVVGHVRL
jgi:hypothetical protein